MPGDAATQEFNADLAQVLVDMATTPSLERRRELFHEELHRVFDPDFLPAFFQLIGVMSQVGGEAELAATANVFGAVVLEVRDFLTGLPAETLSPAAIGVDLIVQILAATIALTEGEDDPGVALATTVLRYYDQLHDGLTPALEAIEGMAVLAEARGVGTGPLAENLREVAENWRDTASKARMLALLLSAVRGPEEEVSDRIAGIGGDIAMVVQASMTTTWLIQALAEAGDFAESANVQKLRDVLMESIESMEDIDVEDE